MIPQIKSLLLPLFILLTTSSILHSQTYFTQLPDATGYADELQAHQLDSLNAAAQELTEALPNAELQGDFGVYDMGFYRHHTTYEGGIPDVMQKAIDGLSTSYYLFFGREIGEEGEMKKVWVEMELPELSCFNEAFYFGLMEQLDFILHNPNNYLGLIYDSQVKAINEMENYILQTLKCCISFRSTMSEIDSGDISINLRHPDGPEWFFLSENDVILISDLPDMPSISFKLDYTGLESEIHDNMCYDLNAILKITYLRPCISTGNGNNYSRNDSVTFSIENIGFDLFYTFKMDLAEAYGEMFEMIRGGRAKITVTDNLGEVLGTFNFTIKGDNPTMGQVFYYIDERENLENIWFWDKMILAESGTPHGFGLEAHLRQFLHYDIDHENLEEDWLAKSRCPLYAVIGDCGIGMLQLTEPAPHAQALWDWRSQIWGAYHLMMGEKRHFVRNYMERDLIEAFVWDLDNEMDKVELIDTLYGGIHWVMANSELFPPAYSGDINNYFPEASDEGKRSLLDACLIMAYNGYGGTSNNHNNHTYNNFLYIWREGIDGKPKWAIKDNVNDYVWKVSSRNVPAH